MEKRDYEITAEDRVKKYDSQRIIMSPRTRGSIPQDPEKATEDRYMALNQAATRRCDRNNIAAPAEYYQAKQDLLTDVAADADRMDQADELMTETLQALEASDFPEASRIASKVLKQSDSIEQRLAALYLRLLAEVADPKAVQAALAAAYGHSNIERR